MLTIKNLHARVADKDIPRGRRLNIHNLTVVLVMLTLAAFTQACRAQEKDQAQRKKVEQILAKHFAVDNKKLLEKNFDGFLFGAGRDKQPEVEKDKKGKELIKLRYENDKLVAVTKSYRHDEIKSGQGGEFAMKKSYDRVRPLLGDPNEDKAWHFEERLTTKKTQYRLSYPNLIAYVSPAILVGAGSANVTIFDRDFLLNVYRKDLLEKLKILEACKPAADAVKAGDFDLAKSPLPKFEGCIERSTKSTTYKALLLQGRKAPIVAAPVVLNHDFQPPPRGLPRFSLWINFESLPTYEPPAYFSGWEEMSILVRENQYLTAALAEEVFGGAEKSKEITTISALHLKKPGNSPFHQIAWKTVDGLEITIGHPLPSTRMGSESSPRPVTILKHHLKK